MSRVGNKEVEAVRKNVLAEEFDDVLLEFRTEVVFRATIAGNIDLRCGVKKCSVSVVESVYLSSIHIKTATSVQVSDISQSISNTLRYAQEI